MKDATLDVVEEAPLASYPESDATAGTNAGPREGPATPLSERDTMTRILRDGLLTGLLGYATLVLFFAVASMAAGHSPFHVAALLASALFRLPMGPGAAIDPGPVIAYNGLHLIVLILAGMLLAGLARVAARALQGWYVALMAVVFALAHIVALPIWFGDRLSAELPIWLVVTGTALATVVMCAYLWIANPDIRTAMHEPDE
jgi:hypothetical protein